MGRAPAQLHHERSRHDGWVRQAAKDREALREGLEPFQLQVEKADDDTSRPRDEVGVGLCQGRIHGIRVFGKREALASWRVDLGTRPHPRPRLRAPRPAPGRFAKSCTSLAACKASATCRKTAPQRLFFFFGHLRLTALIGHRSQEDKWSERDGNLAVQKG